MSTISRFMSGRYRECLNHPVYVIGVMLVVIVLAATQVHNFRFDASSETLLPEGDSELAYYREVTQDLGTSQFIFLTYAPPAGDLFTRAELGRIAALQERLQRISGVSAVYSILDAPLLQSPPVALEALAQDVPTLRDDDVDPQLARQELTTSPLFAELLVSTDGHSTALRIDLEPSLQRDEVETTLADIREIRDALPGDVTAHIGGVPVVASDMIGYIRSDMALFGGLVIVLIGIMLFWIFRRIRWVLLPLLSTGVVVLITMGVLGFLGQATTVISSNFISLLSIITISFSIHLIARYREIRATEPDIRHTDMVYRAARDKLAPCIYTAITTMVAFGSLITSDIKPVADFGWIMCIGILVSFIVSYSFFVGILLLLPKGEAATTLHHEPALTRYLADLSTRRTGAMILLMVVSFAVAALGMTRVSMDNRFIEYFRADTEIHQGLQFIDEHLGGTIPFDVIVEFDAYEAQEPDSDNPFLDAPSEGGFSERYWFTADKIRILADIGDYLEQRPEIGKVISLATLEKIGRSFNDGQPLGSVELIAALGAMPEDIRDELIAPYAAPERGIMRISARLHETGVAYSHEELFAEINRHLTEELHLAPEDFTITGMAVFFNSMLKELFDSQRSTIAFVIAITFLMFLVLLRSATMAVLGLLPNILAAGSILAIMGFVGIPLDVMTITIAAIIIGIGVDDAIHYLHRFQIEFGEGCDAREAVRRTHASIGNAIYYTSATVVIGFSVLGFSMFMPTVYFGLLTALAMVLALLANLTLLPSLLILVYGRRGARVVPRNDATPTANAIPPRP